jgi:hypothetical protein
MVPTMHQLTLALDLERFPRKPYCVDRNGEPLQIQTLAKALTYRHLQCNPPHAVYWVLIDIDDPVISDPVSPVMKKILDGGVPLPNFLVVNQQSGTAHIYYALARPVPRHDHNHIRAHRYVAAIEAALIRELGADAGYCNLVAKNPFHEHWRRIDLRSEPYTLHELEDYLNLKGPSKSEQREAQLEESRVKGEMRNCTLFDKLRFHAYPLAKTYQEDANFEQWERYLDRAADKLNSNLSNPLDYQELKHIIRSVARWTYYKYTGTLSHQQFSSLQAWRGRISAKARTAAAEAKGSSLSEQMKAVRRHAEIDKGRVAAAHKMKSEGVKVAEIARQLNLSRQTVYAYLKKVSNDEP